MAIGERPCRHRSQWVVGVHWVYGNRVVLNACPVCQEVWMVKEVPRGNDG